MTMLEDQQALQLVLENLSSIGHTSVNGIASTRPTKPLSQNCSLTQPYNGMIYNITGKSFMKESVLSSFDLRKSPNSLNVPPNITEHVYVPTSEHVAEIVGRQGCKIKALRNKTNTYIKTPGRGEDPLFIITGQPEDVAMAVNEIKQASEHFTNIRAQRNKGLSPPTSIPGQITIKVRVPYRVVGLVVGPKGATIKQIQTKTSTYIVTPSRERDPIFEITGLPLNVENAKNEITNYIAMRTGACAPLGDENAMGLSPGLPTSNSTNILTRTPTGVWNPNKQDIDEISSFSDAINSVNNIYGAAPSNNHNAGVNAQSAYSEGLNDFPGAGFLTEDLFVPNSVSSAVNPLLDISNTFNDENMDTRFPVSSAFKVDSLKSPLGVSTASATTGYNPFIWDNSSLFKMPPKSPFKSYQISAAADSFNSRAFNPVDPNKVSPMSTGSQHSSTESGNSLMAFNFDAPTGNGMGDNVRKNFTDLWVSSPPVGKSPSKCHSCHVQSIGAAFIPCGHHQFCWGCARERIGSSCPSCAQTVEDALRIIH